jgi:hypothetical protein
MPETEPLRATDVHREVDLGYIFCSALFSISKSTIKLFGGCRDRHLGVCSLSAS